MSRVAFPIRWAFSKWANTHLLMLMIWSAASFTNATVTATRTPGGSNDTVGIKWVFALANENETQTTVESNNAAERLPAAASQPIQEFSYLADYSQPEGESLVFPPPDVPVDGLHADDREYDFSADETLPEDSWKEDLFAGADQGEAWDWHILPDGLIYRSYLAGAKESRMASFWAHEKDEGWFWDNTLGGRAPVLRYGTDDPFHPEGWQLDIEGAALLRLDTEEERDLVAADFRFGVPLTYGVGRYQTKIAYYHLSSHLGDEYSLKHPDVQRINYSRDVLVWGHSYFLTDDLRVYAEAGYAFFRDVSKPWEFQFGVDYSPAAPTGFYGAPFYAFNGALREEVDFGGNLVVQFGRQWRGADSGHLFRAGVEYYNGKSDQFTFFNQTEEKIGVAIWYDF